MACPYYREPIARESIGCCNDNPAGIPSKTHQDCLCQSLSGIYVDFCPIYAKLEQAKLRMQSQSIIKRVLVNSYRWLVYNDELKV
jgi:hypothetical protein